MYDDYSMMCMYIHTNIDFSACVFQVEMFFSYVLGNIIIFAIFAKYSQTTKRNSRYALICKCNGQKCQIIRSVCPKMERHKYNRNA